MRSLLGDSDFILSMLFVTWIGLLVNLGAAEVAKQPRQLTDKQRADAAVAYGLYESAYRRFLEVKPIYERNMASAQDAQIKWLAVQSAMRKESGAPDDCRLNGQMAWVRDAKTVQGNVQEVACEIEAPKPAEKK